jgi:phosphate:Na+ symporter
MRTALINIVNVAEDAFKRGDISLAFEVEPIEEVIDDLRDAIKANHIERLKNSRCTIEHGFVLSDILTNFERVSDHCSNVGECVIEISKHETLDMHKYIEHIKEEDKHFEERYEYYKELYKIV